MSQEIMFKKDSGTVKGYFYYSQVTVGVNTA